jgi:glycerol kinase
MAKYVVAIDQGTTGTTVLVLDRKLGVKAKVTQEFPQHFPRPGWVEHDLEEIWDSTTSTLRRALSRAGVSGRDVAAVGITNQRETVAVWSRRSDAPVARAIVWQDRRTAVDCQRLKDAGREPWIRERTGLVLDPYFSATKLRWMLDHVKGLRARAHKGEVAFGTIDTFLAWRLTGGKAHVTDPSSA